MDFFLNFDFPKTNLPIDYDDSILFLGSCFTENIGLKFQKHLFKTCINPNGIYYHPLSIARFLEQVLAQEIYTEKDLTLIKGLYKSWFHHSDFSHHDASEFLKILNQIQKDTFAFLEKSKYLFITWGSAHCYYLKENNVQVDNCHKHEANLFYKKCSAHKEIFLAYENLFKKLAIQFPSLQIVISISPVRYKKDGLIENTISKSHLFIALEKLKLNFENIYYFPAYEIVIDELRDYRFFKEDCVHPSDLAIEYIWKRVCEKMMSDKTISTLSEIQSLVQASEHKVLNKEGEEYLKFKETHQQKVQNLQNKYPNIFFDEIENHFNSL